LFVVFAACLVRATLCATNCETSAISFVAVDESDEDSYSFATELANLEAYDGSSVLGFKNFTIYNPNYSTVNNPCIQLSADSTGYKIALLAQPYPLGEGFCVNSDIGGFAEQCNVNEFKWCNDGNTAANAVFQFSCYQTSCEKSSIPLYIKIVISDSDDAGEIEYWCDSTNDTYPSDLIRTAPEIAPDYTGDDPSQTKIEKDLNAGLGLKISAILSILTPLFIAVLF